eukprot:4029297-Prymnesium_polylepis.1
MAGHALETRKRLRLDGACGTFEAKRAGKVADIFQLNAREDDFSGVGNSRPPWSAASPTIRR